MARVTIEDCLEHASNRFNLVLIASKRAHQLSSFDSNPLVPIDNDKETVIALREIAQGLLVDSYLMDVTDHSTLNHNNESFSSSDPI